VQRTEDGPGNSHLVKRVSWGGLAFTGKKENAAFHDVTPDSLQIKLESRVICFFFWGFYGEQKGREGEREQKKISNPLRNAKRLR